MHVESSANNKSPIGSSTTYNQVTFQLVSKTNNSVERSVTIKSPCRESSVQLQTSDPEDSSSANKSLCREFSYVSGHPVESSVEIS